MKAAMRVVLCFLNICIIHSAIAQPLPASAAPAEKEDIIRFLTEAFQARNQLLIDPTPERISGFYQDQTKSGLQAKQHELRRSQYMQTWAKERKLGLSEAEGTIRLTRFRQDGDSAKVSLIQTAKLSYQYSGQKSPVQSFGVGTRHALTLQKADGRWRILREWYMDPLDENPNLVPTTDSAVFPQRTPASFPDNEKYSETTGAKPRNYNRKKAVAYANKYAGTAWGAGNNGKYNAKYKDYNYVGGDCTNFASQVLGDRDEGGGLKMTGAWRYLYPTGGSTAWIRTDGLKNFLLHSGYGRLIAKGTFPEVIKPTDKHPHGALARLQPGDFIGYVLEGELDHFCVVVGHDVNGYPLVNSHTADRYRVPFDLGWDKFTTYLLIHIKD